MSNHADYDTASLFVEPDQLKTIADNLTANASDVATSTLNITNTLSDLQLGWAGQSAQEANDIANRWDAVMNELFGTEDDPSTGVLNAIVDGLMTARDGFSKTEDALAKLFSQFRDQLTAGGAGSTPPQAPPNMDDITMTAITETW
jgi:uncharacterized protein YukE